MLSERKLLRNFAFGLCMICLLALCACSPQSLKENMTGETGKEKETETVYLSQEQINEKLEEWLTTEQGIFTIEQKIQIENRTDEQDEQDEETKETKETIRYVLGGEEGVLCERYDEEAEAWISQTWQLSVWQDSLYEMLQNCLAEGHVTKVASEKTETASPFSGTTFYTDNNKQTIEYQIDSEGRLKQITVFLEETMPETQEETEIQTETQNGSAGKYAGVHVSSQTTISYQED